MSCKHPRQHYVGWSVTPVCEDCNEVLPSICAPKPDAPKCDCACHGNPHSASLCNGVECICHTPKEEPESKLPHDFEVNLCGGSQCKKCGQTEGRPVWPPFCDERLLKREPKEEATCDNARRHRINVRECHDAKRTEESPTGSREYWCSDCGLPVTEPKEPAKCEDRDVKCSYACCGKLCRKGKICDDHRKKLTPEPFIESCNYFTKGEVNQLLVSQRTEMEAEERHFRKQLLDTLSGVLDHANSKKPFRKEWYEKIDHLRKRFSYTPSSMDPAELDYDYVQSKYRVEVHHESPQNEPALTVFFGFLFTLAFCVFGFLVCFYQS